MELTFDILERAFAPVEKIGKEEMVVPVGATTLTLRSLLPEEEADAQRSSSNPVEGSDAATITDAIEYIERFKIATLSYAIVAVGDQDFHGVRFVENGETIENNGKIIKVTVPLHQALRKMILKWTGPVRTQVFKNYSELLLKVERTTMDQIKYDPADLESDLERAKLRVKKLEADIERRKKDTNPLGMTSGQVFAIAKGSDGDEEEVEQGTPQEVAEAPQEAPAPRQPPIPPPPPIQRQMPPLRPEAPSMSPPPRKEMKRPQPGDDIPDSFLPNDNMEQAIESENIRLMEERRRMGNPVPTTSAALLDESRSRFGSRRPPHAGASETAAALVSEPEIPNEFTSTGRNQPEFLGRRPDVNPSPVVIDAPAKTSRNPRFNPRKDA